MKLFLKNLFFFHIISNGGSEHTVNGHRYAGEMHLVHYNRKYENLTIAKPRPDGLAVLGIFFQLAENSTYNPRFANTFVKHVASIPNEDDVVTINDFKSIRDLIKYDVKDFFSYRGK